MTRPLDQFDDIHAHSLDRATDGRTVVSIEPGTPIQPEGHYSVGIHPWHTDTPVTLSQLKALVAGARDPRVVAIGECGFDALRGGSVERQRALFDFHARLAERLGKPLIIHAVRSDAELHAAIRRIRPRQRWIIHGFRGKPQAAQALLQAGYSLSLGHHYNPATEAIIPPDRLYRETDD